MFQLHRHKTPCCLLIQEIFLVVAELSITTTLKGLRAETTHLDALRCTTHSSLLSKYKHKIVHGDMLTPHSSSKLCSVKGRHLSFSSNGDGCSSCDHCICEGWSLSDEQFLLMSLPPESSMLKDEDNFWQLQFCDQSWSVIYTLNVPSQKKSTAF